MLIHIIAFSHKIKTMSWYYCEFPRFGWLFTHPKQFSASPQHIIQIYLTPSVILFIIIFVWGADISSPTLSIPEEDVMMCFVLLNEL